MFVLKQFKNGLTGPVAVCDVCGKEVSADKGNILWHPEGDETVGDVFSIACIGDCTRRMDTHRGHHCFMRLSSFIVHLISNTNTDVEKVKRSATLSLY